RILRIGHDVGGILRLPLRRACRTLRLDPFVTEQIVQILGREVYGIGRPSAFQTAGDRVVTFAGSAVIDPTKALTLHALARGRGAHAFRRRVRAVRLAEGVAADDER